jgi:hypothetical protein
MAITRRSKPNGCRRQELQEIGTEAFEEGDMESLNNVVAEAAAMEPDFRLIEAKHFCASVVSLL